MKAIIAFLLALCLSISLVAGDDAMPGPSVYIVLVSRTAAASNAAATGASDPNFQFLGLGEPQRLEVNVDFANKKENIEAIVSKVLSARKNSDNGTIAIDLKEKVFRTNLIETLTDPMLQRRKTKYGKFIEDMFIQYQSQLQECPYESCEDIKCNYPKGTDRQQGLLRESCIGQRNMARYQVLRADYETIVQEIKQKLASSVDIDILAGVTDSSPDVEFADFEDLPELAGDWSCTGKREGGIGCPTATVTGVTTTLTGTIIKTYWGLEGVKSHTWIWPQTFTGTESMHAEYPLVTGTSEHGPDADQIAKDPAPQHMWTHGVGWE